MSFLLDPIVQWLQNLLVSGIMSNLSGLFDGINDRVMGIAGEVGASGHPTEKASLRVSAELIPVIKSKLFG